MGNLTCCKYLMFFFNLLIFLGGAVLFGTGIWIVADSNSFADIVSSDPMIFGAVYLLIAVGGVIFVTGFLGCCGAMRESKCLLNTFFLVVLILFVVELAAIILAFVNESKLEEVVLKSMEAYGSNEVIKDGWDTLQSGMDCCGYNNAADWVAVVGLNVINGDKASLGTSSCALSTGIGQPGCKSVIQGYFIIIGGIGIGVLFIELLAMIFACCLSRSVGKDRYA